MHCVREVLSVQLGNQVRPELSQSQGDVRAASVGTGQGNSTDVGGIQAERVHPGQGGEAEYEPLRQKTGN